MLPRIETLSEKKLVGQQMVMSLSQNKTSELWRSFIARRREITNAVGNDLYSMQVYNDQYFANFNPGQEFTKMAAIEVADFTIVPEGMAKFILPDGLYAVFHHKGGPTNGAAIFQYIFATWIPSSEYKLDNRPHFEVLGENYKNDDPNSEEEIWIPIKQKG